MGEPLHFGALVRRARLAAGLTQEALAERAGVSPRGVGDIERGVSRAPQRETVALLAEALGLTGDDRAVFEAAAQRLAARPPAGPPPGSNPAAVAATPLPVPATSFVGREQELAEVRRLLATTRLLTLTGAGGVGKTRLALEVARAVQAEYADGVWLVEFAALTDPLLVPQAVAQTLGVPEQPGRPVIETLRSWLAAKHVLVVLDNCEHLLEACAHLADTLLGCCPPVHLLATSREPLGIAGETTWRVPSLAVPEGQHLPPAEDVRRFEAVRLFLERAQAALPGGAVTDQHLGAVVHICARLDGIPLAIELAAARVRALPVEHLARRLDDRFRLLTGGSRTALPRQQTLRATIDWSHDLLTEREQIALRRLAVFAGGWTVEAAEAVCADDGIDRADVFDLLVRLVDRSLVLAGEPASPRLAGEARYRLLETVRQYAAERLQEAGDELRVRRRHADWYLALAEQAQPALFGAEEVVWLDRLEAEHDNLRAALAWSLDHDPAAALRFVNALWAFWWVRSYFAEGYRWAERALARAPERCVQRVWALDGAAVLARGQGGDAVARPLWEESLALSRELGDRPSSVFALGALGELLIHQDRRRARTLLEEGLAIRRAMGEGPTGIGTNLMHLGRLARAEGDYQRARALHAESLALLRQAGGRWMVSGALADLGQVALVEGDTAPAQALFEEALAVARELGTGPLITRYLCDLGRVAQWQGDVQRARDLYDEGLALARAVEAPEEAALALAGLGQVAELEGDLERASALLGESQALFADQGKTHHVASVLHARGRVARRQGDTEQAATLLHESLAQQWDLGERLDIAACLEALAAVGVETGQAERAVRLLGATEVLRQTIGAPLPPVERPDYEATVQAARAALGEPAFREAWAAGQALSLEQAVAEALGEEEPRRADGTPPTTAGTPVALQDLTPRELDVLRLLVQGATDGAIAGELSISVRTVNKHVASVLSKTGCANRTAAVAFALRHSIT